MSSTLTPGDLLDMFDVPDATALLILERTILALMFERATTDREARERGLGSLREAALAWEVGHVSTPLNQNRDGFRVPVYRMGARYGGLSSSFRTDAQLLRVEILAVSSWPSEGSFFVLTPTRPGWQPSKPPEGYPTAPFPPVRKRPRPARPATRGERAFGPVLGNCAFCETMVREASFKDALSRREWDISKLCQSCQDKVFAEPEDEGAETC